MNLESYLIPPLGLNWPQLLASWGWIFPGPFAVCLVNRFGDPFVVYEDGTIHLLDVGSGVLRQVASNLPEFRSHLADPAKVEEWLMVPLVDALVAARKVPGPGQCYSYRQLPVFGGEYTPDNVILRDLATHYAAFGPIHERIKDLPDGAQVSFQLEP